MHIHATQFNLDMQMNALYAAARAEAKQEAERTRKKLGNFASALAGQVDDADCIVSFTKGVASRQQSNQQESQSKSTQNEQAAEEDLESNASSYWA